MRQSSHFDKQFDHFVDDAIAGHSNSCSELVRSRRCRVPQLQQPQVCCCLVGHPLTHTIEDVFYHCSKCNGRVEAGRQLQTCFECRYHLCQGCAANATPPESSATARAPALVAAVSANAHSPFIPVQTARPGASNTARAIQFRASRLASVARSGTYPAGPGYLARNPSLVLSARYYQFS